MIQPHGWKRWEDVEAPICPVISAQTVKQANMYIECVKEKCVWWDKCKGSEEQRPQGTCKTCKYYVPYREQFSNRQRGDGYCKSTITTSEGQAYINCHDEWYCANYEKGGSK